MGMDLDHLYHNLYDYWPGKRDRCNILQFCVSDLRHRQLLKHKYFSRSRIMAELLLTIRCTRGKYIVLEFIQTRTRKY